jgi:hypothetical protein
MQFLGTDLFMAYVARLGVSHDLEICLLLQKIYPLQEKFVATGKILGQ